MTCEPRWPRSAARDRPGHTGGDFRLRPALHRPQGTCAELAVQVMFGDVRDAHRCQHRLGDIGQADDHQGGSASEEHQEHGAGEMELRGFFATSSPFIVRNT